MFLSLTVKILFHQLCYFLFSGDLTHTQQDGNDSLDTSGSSIGSDRNIRSESSNRIIRSESSNRIIRSELANKLIQSEPPLNRSIRYEPSNRIIRSESSIRSKRKRKRNVDTLLQEGIQPQDEDSSDG